MKPEDDSKPAVNDAAPAAAPKAPRTDAAPPAGDAAQDDDAAHAPQPRTERVAPAGEVRPERPPLEDPSARPDTRTQRGTSDEEPRLPHEHDESADSQGSEPREVIRQAQKDVERGLVDTDKGPVLDSTYQRQKTPTDKSG